ncbi:MAG: class I SAM-dependent methyltransferase [Deltaproteobacteria bacterium]|nr:class I SAM-dependent methyltransferase [Deltaproteobacteria bacterium]
MHIQKQIHNMTYYTGAHPEIRNLFRNGNRPSEFGAKVWPTSLRTIDFLAQHESHATIFKKGCRVLEIGCGWGLIGVYLACAHSCDVTCSDLDPLVLPVVQLHARRNGVKVRTVQYSFKQLSESFLKQFDVIIGAEVCYSEDVANELTQLLQRAFRASVSHMIVVDPGRPDFDDFHQFCQSRFSTELFILPGSANGQHTRLLHVTPLSK